jgi:hypothetical protein
MSAKRNRRKNTVPLDERLQKAASDARQAAEHLPQGDERDALLKKARQSEMAAHLDQWLSAPGEPQGHGPGG